MSSVTVHAPTSPPQKGRGTARQTTRTYRATARICTIAVECKSPEQPRCPVRTHAARADGRGLSPEQNWASAAPIAARARQHAHDRSAHNVGGPRRRPPPLPPPAPSSKARTLVTYHGHSSALDARPKKIHYAEIAHRLLKKIYSPFPSPGQNSENALGLLHISLFLRNTIKSLEKKSRARIRDSEPGRKRSRWGNVLYHRICRRPHVWHREGMVAGREMAPTPPAPRRPRARLPGRSASVPRDED